VGPANGDRIFTRGITSPSGEFLRTSKSKKSLAEKKRLRWGKRRDLMTRAKNPQTSIIWPFVLAPPKERSKGGKGIMWMATGRRQYLPGRQQPFCRLEGRVKEKKFRRKSWERDGWKTGGIVAAGCGGQAGFARRR